MANEKEFKIKINGLEEAYSSASKLVEVLKHIENVSAKVEVETAKAAKAMTESAKATAEKTKATTEENKAEKELEATLTKRRELDTQIAREQINATQALKERTVQLEKSIELENTASGSMNEMRLQIEAMEKTYKALSVEERNSEQQGVVMLDQLREKKEAYNKLEASMKEERESLGKSFKAMGKGIDETLGHTSNMIEGIQESIKLTQHLGIENDTLTKTLDELGKVMGVVKVLQTTNNALLKEGGIMDGIRIIQTKAAAKAKDLEAASTGKATIAQGLYNAVAKANPYVLLAMALLTVIGAVVAYTAATDKGTESQKKYISSLDGTVHASKEAMDAHNSHKRTINDLQMEYDLLTGAISKYDAALNRLASEKAEADDRATEELNKAQKELDDKMKEALGGTFWTASLKDKLEALHEHQEKTKKLEEKAATEKTQRQTEYNKREKLLEQKQIQDKLKFQQEYSINMLDGLEKDLAILEQKKSEALRIAEQLQIDSSIVMQSFAKEEDKLRDGYAKKATDTANTAASKRVDKAKEMEEKRLRIESELQDERLKAMEAGQEKEVALAEEAKKRRLAQIEGNSQAEKDLREQIEANAAAEMAKIKDEYSAKEQEAALQAELTKSKALLITLQEGSAAYIAEKEKELNTILGIEAHAVMTSTKTEEEKNNQLILLNNKYNADLAKLSDDNAKQVNEKKLKDLKDAQAKEMLQETQNLENKIIKKKEFEERKLKITLEYLEKEIALLKSQGKDTTAQEQQLSEQRIGIAEKDKNKRNEQLEEFKKKFNETTGKIMEGANAAFGAAKAIMDMGIEDAKEKLATISAQYDEVVGMKEKSNERIRELETQAQGESGQRLLEVRAMIDDEMAANKKLADQKTKLAKDKEKQEQEIAKKEKQAKKTEIMQNIITSIANTSMAVVSALPNLILAGIVGVAGAVQVGVMTAQLAKLEDGGLLRGKRHAGGGMRVEGTNIEVEGGEYVVNRESTDKNLGLIRYINSQRRQLAPQDLNAFFAKSSQGFEPPFKQLFEQGGRLPDTEAPGKRENYAEEFREAIKGLKIVTVMEELRRADENYINLTERSI